MIAAEWLRMVRGGGAVRWGRDGVAAGFLRVATGQEPSAELVRAFDGALTLRADNELNPGTFAARVAASTGGDLVSCVVAALGALAGPRHSGHTVAVARLLAAAEQHGPAAAVQAALAHAPKPAGFGHPVYRGEDPRTPVARQLSKLAADNTGRRELHALAEAVEAEVQRRASLAANVDYYLTVIYLAGGLPVPAFGSVFAVARMPGWIAHILEQRQEPDLIRPRAVYVGQPGRRHPARAPRSPASRAVT
jgi:citrate synthase